MSPSIDEAYPTVRVHGNVIFFVTKIILLMQASTPSPRCTESTYCVRDKDYVPIHTYTHIYIYIYIFLYCFTLKWVFILVKIFQISLTYLKVGRKIRVKALLVYKNIVVKHRRKILTSVYKVAHGRPLSLLATQCPLKSPIHFYCTRKENLL